MATLKKCECIEQACMAWGKVGGSDGNPEYDCLEVISWVHQAEL